MERKVLGRTGERIPVLGMGTWGMGNSTSERRKEELLALGKGIELGMRFIDTAEAYGNGKSETLVGEAIREVRDDVFLATKVSPDHFSHDEVLKSCEASLQRLGVTLIDLYQLHWPSSNIPIQETMRAMDELVSQGKVRYIGVSNFSVEQTVEAQESLPRSELVSNQVQYSIKSREVESDLLPFCEKDKITMIAYSPLDRGNIPLSKLPKELMTKYGLTAAQTMLNWVTYRKPVMAIPKTGRIDHVEENSESVDVTLSDDDYRKLSGLFA